MPGPRSSELNDIGVMGRWVEAEEDSNEGVFRLDQHFETDATHL